jgi:hypothetical protein
MRRHFVAAVDIAVFRLSVFHRRPHMAGQGGRRRGHRLHRRLDLVLFQECQTAQLTERGQEPICLTPFRFSIIGQAEGV